MVEGDRQFLLKFFRDLDEKIEEKHPGIKVDLVVLGGSFFVLKKIRKNSPDIDFIGLNSTAHRILVEIATPLAKKRGVTVDILYENVLNDIFLPKNFMRLSKPYKRERSKRKHLNLWTLSPYYIILSKLSRYSEKDVRDIKLIMECGKFTIRKKKLINEANKMNFAHKQKQFNKNFEEFLEKYDSKLKKSWLNF